MDLYSRLPVKVLPMLDRATMGASIEGRVPFLNKPLVEFTFSISEETKLGRRPAPKRLLKQSLQGRIPDAILKRRKSGLPSPAQILIREQYNGVLPGVLLAADSYVREILPPEFLRESLANADCAARNWRVLYSLLVFEIWHKQFVRDRNYTRPECSVEDIFHIPSRRASCFAGSP